MGDKLGKMVKLGFLVISLFFLNLNADLNKSSVSLISSENISDAIETQIFMKFLLHLIT